MSSPEFDAAHLSKLLRQLVTQECTIQTRYEIDHIGAKSGKTQAYRDLINGILHKGDALSRDPE